jgi:hypothetical protein
MSVELRVAGEYTPADQAERDDVQKWLRRLHMRLVARASGVQYGIRTGNDAKGRAALRVDLHPSANPLEFVVPRSGRVEAAAMTSPVGPGYHSYVCELLTLVGKDLKIDWKLPEQDKYSCDETDFFFTGDLERLEQCMLGWLRVVSDTIVHSLGQKDPALIVAMSFSHQYRYHGPVVTPLGPRDAAWWQAVNTDPRNGIDFFPWWSEGKTAPFYLGRALVRMWRDVRWRMPMGVKELSLVLGVLSDLTKAYQLDSTLSYPWVEWAELIDHFKTLAAKAGAKSEPALDAEIYRRAKSVPPGPRIGYRRQPVRVALSEGWSIEIPGEMREDKKDNGVLYFWGGGRTVWFALLPPTPNSRARSPEELERVWLLKGEKVDFRNDKVTGTAVFSPTVENGKNMWMLRGVSEAGAKQAVCSIVFLDRRDRDWAVATWKSIQPPRR